MIRTMDGLHTRFSLLTIQLHNFLPSGRCGFVSWNFSFSCVGIHQTVQMALLSLSLMSASFHLQLFFVLYLLVSRKYSLLHLPEPVQVHLSQCLNLVVSDEIGSILSISLPYTSATRIIP